MYVVSDLAWCEYWDVLSNHTKQNYLQMLQIRSAMHKVSLWSCERLLQQSNPSFLRQSGLKNKNYVYFQTNVEQNLTILYTNLNRLSDTCHNIQRIIYTESNQEDREGSVYNGGNKSNYGCGIRFKMITSGGNGNLFNMFISI